MTAMGPREYYRRLTEIEIGGVARELLGDRIVHEAPNRLECDCPRHKSRSHRSLHIMLDKQGWYCFGCSMGGDVLQLVELVQSGTVTRGARGEMPESHRRARDYLAQKVGLPSLGQSDVDLEKLKELEAARAQEVRTQETLTALAGFYHQRLRVAPEALEWVKTKYGLTDKTVDELLIGYADNGSWRDETGREFRNTVAFLTRDGTRTLRDLSATGAFMPTHQDTLRPFFDRRIVFPYWSRGRVVFMIGRRAPWTPKSKWEQGKYKKLLVHDPKKRPYVAPCVHNGYIYNEDCLLDNPKQIMITEGVTDCIAAMQAGIPCISPVTTRFRTEDIARLVRLTNRAGRVVICNDSEESGAGEEGALRTAAALHAAGRDVRIATIPRPEDKEKIDVNELVATQGTEVLEKVLGNARRYPEYLLLRIPEDTPKDELKAALKPVLDLVAEADPLDQQIYLDAMVERFNLGRQALKRQIKKNAQENRMATAEAHGPAGLPQIRVNDRQLSEIVREAGEILVASNNERLEQAAQGVERPGGVPIVFVRSGGLVRLAHRDHDVSLSMMDRDTVHAVITRIGDWFRVTDNGMFPVFPPRDVSRDLLTLAPEGLPVLESVISTPVFGVSGDLIDQPGHHAKDRLWLQPSKALKLSAVPKKPSRRQVDDARALILDELLSDFPFAHPADRAGAMAALFLPFVRRVIAGPTPLHLVEAPTPGSGKSLLCNLISIVAIGAAAEARTLPDQEEEVRKMLTAELSRARPIILLDNATERKKIDSSALASIATSEVWTDRLLGSSKMLSLKNNALWMLTANNPRISNELTRRCIRIRVDPRQDRPWQREGFKHDPITEWTRKERPNLVHAALTLAQAWVAEGSPLGTIRLGSFEGWSAVMGGLLQVSGVDGFLANLNEFYAQADTDGEAWREFIAAWWQEFGGEDKRISELNDFCEREGLMNSVRGDKSARSQQSRLGRALQSARDRVFDTLRFQLAEDRCCVAHPLA